MKTLTKQFKDILVEFDVKNKNQIMTQITKAVKERDSYIIGEDEKKTYGDDLESVIFKDHINDLKAEIRQRAEETL